MINRQSFVQLVIAFPFLAAVSTLFAQQGDAELKAHFGEQQFSPRGGFVLKVGDKLPALVWENPKLVARVVDDITIPTRWFNESFKEVTTAAKPGRYYAYGEAPVPNGRALRRAMTCCAVSDNTGLADLAASQFASAKPDSKVVKDAVQKWRTTEVGAVELAALLWEHGDSPAKGHWQMENATRHVRLKRKLMGLEDQPIIKPTVRTLEKRAPELRTGSLKEAQVTSAQVAAINAKLNQWYAEAKQPTAVVIAKNGVIFVAKAYGEVEEEPATIDTPMALDSAMKPLIGLQLATYVDQGHIGLDEPIGKHLPDFNTKEDQNLTFRAGHVHASGIEFPWELAFRRLFYFHTWHESLIAHCPREWKPGENHRYGVVGVILSVRALELLRGRNYWDAMQRDLFAPLGIHNVLPGGRGCSAESLARIGVLLCNRGKYGKYELISEATHAAILPTDLSPHFPQLKMKWGIGFQQLQKHLGPGSYGHGGGGGTLLVVNPHKHLVFAMVRNNQGTNYKEYRSQLMELLRKIE